MSRTFLFILQLEINSYSEEEVSCFSVIIFDDIAEAIFISNFER